MGVLRERVRFAFRVAKGLSTDRRLPRYLRGMIVVSLAIKTVLLPDLGIDEILLGIAALLLLTRYRSTFSLIVQDAR